MNSKEKTFLKLIDEYKIEIPIMQRDYAQGRQKEKTVRNNFLEAIKTTLEDDKTQKLNLDFVYGVVKEEKEEKILYPLDGQQRLTTLFLLHWYAYIKEQKEKSKLNKFTYEIRKSSRTFCEKLVTSGIENLKDIKETIKQEEKNGQIEEKSTLSQKIKDEKWFLHEWENDPTIIAMLNMLDAINLKFNKIQNLSEKLTEENRIVFQFLEVENTELEDDLYIKMNSRGKELEQFENFKAKLEKYLEKDQDEKSRKSISKEILENYKTKFDYNWTEYFWSKAVEKKKAKTTEKELEKPKDEKSDFDNMFMNFFIAIATNNYALKISNDKIIDKDKEKKKLDRLEKYKNREIVNFEEIKETFEENIKEFLEQFYYTLEYISKSNKEETNDIFSKVINANNIISKVTEKETIEYTDLVQFFALCKYIGKKKEIENAELNEFLYYIRNLSENTETDIRVYIRELKSVNEMVEQLIKNNITIRVYIANKENKIEAFNQIQIQAERQKAEKMLNSEEKEEWIKEIVQIDQNKYLEGQTGFLFDFVENAQREQCECFTKKEYLEKYKEYSKKIQEIFSNNEIKKYNKYYFERALLCQGNYLYKVGYNTSFLVDNDRDFSWKSLLKKEKTENSDPKDCMRKLLDKIDCFENIENTEKQLAKIVNNKISELNQNKEESYQIGKWKNYCIKYPKLIELAKENRGYIRFVDDRVDDILILTKRQTSGYNWNFYICVLALTIEEEIEKRNIKDFEIKFNTQYNEEHKRIEIECLPETTAGTDKELVLKIENKEKIRIQYEQEKAKFRIEGEENLYSMGEIASNIFDRLKK